MNCKKNLEERKLYYALVGVLFLITTSCNRSAQDSKAGAQATKKYPVEQLNFKDVELQTVYPTTLKGEVDIEIKPRIDGNIIDVYVDEGAVVKKGQPLFKIDSPSAKQAFETAQANYSTALLDVERMRPLAEKEIISKVVLDSHENALSSAKAAFESAKTAMDWAIVKSPIDGVVGTITFREGSLVNSSSVLTHIAKIDKVVAYFSMNEKDLLSFLKDSKGNSQAEKIKNIPPVKLVLADGSIYEKAGQIETISGVVDNSGAVNFRAVFPNLHGLLRSGTSGKILIPQVLKNVFLIPQKSTFFLQDKVLVFKLKGKKVEQTSVSVKSTPDGLYYAVLHGLSKGDTIVTDGLASLFDGMEIQIQ